MSLTPWALDRTRVVGALILGLSMLGLLGYSKMPRNDMPPFTIRVATIVTQFPGASPERVETLVTDPLEEIAQEIPEAKAIASESRTGLSVLTLELRQDVPAERLQGIWDRLRRKIEAATPDLPDGVMAPVLHDDGIGVVYGVVVGIQNDGFTYSELETYAKGLRDRILGLEDASEVELRGTQEQRIYIDYEPEKLARFGLSSGALRRILAATNIVYPGGSVVLQDERVILEPSGNIGSVAQLKQTLIPLPKGGTVALAELAELPDEQQYQSPAKSLVRINGRPGVTLHIAVRKGANLVRLGEQVDALLASESDELPLGMTLFRVARQDDVVKKSVSDFVGNLLQSIAVVFAVMLLMLGLRTGLVVASLIPTTILLTLFFMGELGQGINKVTLAGLIMALGMLVDNAIVMSEAIVVEMSRGKKPRDAAAQAATELAAPLLISSLTTSAAFLAFFLAESIMGEIVGSLFVVISIALLCSWFLSLTLIPLLVVALVRPAKESSEGLAIRLMRAGYRPTLRFCLRQRALVVVATLLLLAGSVYSFRFLPFIFFPDSERPLVQVDVNTPLGSRIETTDAAVRVLEDYLRSELDDHVVDVTAFVGEGPPRYDLGYNPGEGNSSYAHLLVNTRSGQANQPVIDGINEFARQRLPDADVKASRLANGGRGGAPVEVRVFGDSAADLYAIGERIKQELHRTPGTRTISDTWGPRMKKFIVRIEQNQLRRAGLTHQDVATSLQTVLTGFRTGELRLGDDPVPIIMRADDATNYTVEDVRNVMVHPMAGGGGVPLSQVAVVELAWQYPRVRRRDLRRMYAATSHLEAGYTARDITKPITVFLREDQKSWPKGFYYELGGEAEQSNEGMASVADKLPIGFGLIILLLIYQFNSIRKTGIVLSTVPLGLIGVILGLHAFDSYFGFFGFLGIISLAGIVINNAIVLLDRIRIERVDNQLAAFEAIEVACHHRMRPILLTTLTTTLGLIPLYLGGGAMWEPMAVSIMVGLMFGTLITLVFVPVLYSLLFRVHARS